MTRTPPAPVPRSSVAWLTTPLIALIAAQGALAVVTIPFLLQESSRLQQIHGPIWTAELPSEPWFLSIADVLWPLLFTATAVLWLAWQYRGQGDLVGAGVGGLRFTPAWTVLWWFIPFSNFVRPASAVGELLRGAEAGPGERADLVPASGFVLPWWLPLLGGLIAAGIGVSGRSNLMSAPAWHWLDPREVVWMDRLLVVASICFALAVPTAIMILMRVRRLFARWPSVAVGSPSRPDAPPPVPLRPDAG